MARRARQGGLVDGPEHRRRARLQRAAGVRAGTRLVVRPVDRLGGEAGGEAEFWWWWWAEGDGDELGGVHAEEPLRAAGDVRLDVLAGQQAGCRGAVDADGGAGEG